MSNPSKMRHPECCSVPEDCKLNILMLPQSDLGKGFPGVEFLKPREMPKCNKRAAALRRIGNEQYANGELKDALETYNESICAATADSEHLGLGYANRSALFVQTSAFRVALADIALAKKHNYPARLMSKLLDREERCRRELEAEDAFKVKEKLSPLSLNVPANPKIPFLADGIRAQPDPIFGQVMVAERNFKVGDVILHESPMRVAIDRSFVYLYCNNCCTKNVGHLIPCPNCSAAMYCNEECMREGHRLHRFECGISRELSQVGHEWLGPRMFFHGLSLFEDDIGKMMEFCATAKGSGGNFMHMDYSRYDALEEFKVFLNAKPERPGAKSEGKHRKCVRGNAAVFFKLYMQDPLVKSLITTKAQQTFMLNCFVDFQLIVIDLTVLYNAGCMLFPITAAFGHSCDPKTFVMPTGNTSMVIVIRPIRQGEQIDISYGPTCYQERIERVQQLDHMDFKCPCDYCDKKKRGRWLTKANKPSAIDEAQWTILQRVLESNEANNADKLHAVQQFVQRFAAHYPQKDFAMIVDRYRNMVADYYVKEYQDARTRKIAI